ncbi:hypothetical protein ACFX1X_028992 [Malus domestica]
MEDPIEHLNLFESTMAYRMHTDEERCLLFLFTLSGGALNWYCRLPLETVDSFEELRKLFVSNTSSRPITCILQMTYTLLARSSTSHYKSMPVDLAMSILAMLRQMTRPPSRPSRQAYVIVSLST